VWKGSNEERWFGGWCGLWWLELVWQPLELNESTKCYGYVTQELVSRTRASMRKKKKKKSKGNDSIFLIALALYTMLFIMLPNN